MMYSEKYELALRKRVLLTQRAIGEEFPDFEFNEETMHHLLSTNMELIIADVAQLLAAEIYPK